MHTFTWKQINTALPMDEPFWNADDDCTDVDCDYFNELTALQIADFAAHGVSIDCERGLVTVTDRDSLEYVLAQLALVADIESDVWERYGITGGDDNADCLGSLPAAVLSEIGGMCGFDGMGTPGHK